MNSHAILEIIALALLFLKDKLHSAKPRAITHPSKKRGSCNYFPNCTRIHAITITNLFNIIIIIMYRKPKCTLKTH